jgi:hypothetical protein
MPWHRQGRDHPGLIVSRRERTIVFTAAVHAAAEWQSHECADGPYTSFTSTVAGFDKT